MDTGNVVLHLLAFVGILAIGGAAIGAVFIYLDRRREARELAEFPYDLEFADDHAEFEKVYETSDDNIVWRTGNGQSKKESE